MFVSNFRAYVLLLLFLLKQRKFNLSTEIKYCLEQRECFTGVSKVLIGAPKVFMGAPKNFIGAPNIFIGAQKVFIGAAKVLLEHRMFYWSFKCHIGGILIRAAKFIRTPKVFFFFSLELFILY